MISKAIRLLALIAVLLMPVSMIAPAAAAHHQSEAAMPMQHCPDEQAPGTESGIAQCAMACSAAVPELGSPAPARLTVTCAPPTAIAPKTLQGIQQDIATPPPKRS